MEAPPDLAEVLAARRWSPSVSVHDTSRSRTTRGRGTPRRRRWRRVVLTALVALLAVSVIGALTQLVLERREAAAHPPPGDLVTLPDGRRLHLQVSGDNRAGPVVVLEAGAGASSAAWAWIQPAIAERYRVVSYDRAGLGWSDPRRERPDAQGVVADLRAALQARDLPGPYVLVGHSLGGHFARAFATAHPDDVVGVVLVDPSHEDQSRALGADHMAGVGPMLAALELASRVGLTRLYNPLSVEVTLPEPQRSQVEAEQRSVHWFTAAGAEMTSIDRVGAEVAGRPLGAVPLRVLIAGHGPNEEAQKQVDAVLPLKQEMAEALSADGRAVVLPDAEHITIVTDPDYAAVVSETVLEVADLAADTL